MSDPSSTAPPTSPPEMPPSGEKPWRYSGGQIFMVIVGVILLLPGLCALVVAIGSMPSWNSRDPYLELVLMLWAICFAISAVGVLLIVVARRRAQRTS